MKSYCVYILYSQKIDSFYIGTTDDFDERFMEHNSGIDKMSFSYRGIPWEKFLVIDKLHSKQAYAIEEKIKKMKSKVYIQNLVKYPEIIEKLKSTSL